MSLATISPPAGETSEHKNGSAPHDPHEALLLGAVLAITALVYAATLRFGFVYDDQGMIVGNPLVQSWRYVPEYFRGQVWQNINAAAAGNWYRPLYLLWLRVNDALFGLNPEGWHATTILLHVAATGLAYGVARRLTGKPLVAAATALLFGVHPMRHEVVAWVSCSSESLWAVFFFAAFLAYLKAREGSRVRRLAASCAFYAAALLSKETAVMLPAVVFAHSLIYGGTATEPRAPLRKRLEPAFAMMMPYAPFAGAYFALRMAVLHGVQHGNAGISLGTIALTVPSALLFYGRQWLFPIHAWAFYGMPLRTRFDVLHVLLPALVLLAAAIVVLFLGKKLGGREMYFCLAWMVLLILPVLDFAVLPQGGLVHDRYFYLPSFGMCLVAGLALEKMARGPLTCGVPRAWLLAVLVPLVLLAYGTANASSYWINDETLFSHAYRVTPSDPTVQIDYALQLEQHDDPGGAMQILQQLVKEQPDNWLASANLGRIYYRFGVLEAAETYLLRATQLNPSAPHTYLQLGWVYLKANRPAEAESNLRRAVELKPDEPELRFALGVALKLWGKCDEARLQLAKALELQPGFPHAQEQMDQCVEAE